MKQTDILLVGLSHKTAPIEIRDCLAMDAVMLRSALTHFGDKHHQDQLVGVHEGVILSTCNRLEIYTVVDDVEAARQAIISFVAQATNTPVSQFETHTYHHLNEAAVSHLFKVVSSLDSLVLGEPQILGQITDAYELALSQRSARTIMSKLFQAAIHTGKRVRTETAIGVNPASVSSVAANLAESLLGDLSHRHALLIGAGEMGAVAIQALKHRGVSQVTVVNRTYENALQLAEKWDGRAMSFEQLTEAMVDADIIISSTGAPHLILDRALLEPAMRRRPERLLFLIDIAVPRDISSDVTEIPQVHLYNIDDLQQQVEDNVQERRLEVPRVEQIVQQELQLFWQWWCSLDVVSTVTDLRRQFEMLRQAELQRLFNRIEPDERDKVLIETMSHRLVNKILHWPTVGLKAQAANSDSADYVSAIRDLFALDTASAPPVSTPTPAKPKNGHSP